MRKWLLIALLGFSTTASAQSTSSGKWLVDLGRDYPLSPQASATDSDAEITLLFMQAAARVEPQLAEAWLWQFDMLSALSRSDQAEQSLTQYIKLEPDNVQARLLWTDLNIRAIQTAEQRATFCQKQLELTNLPAEVSSDLHRRLAEFHYNRGELQKAKTEASAAIRDDEFNIEALLLLNELENKTQDALSLVNTLLTLMRANPGDAIRAWQLGDLLLSMELPARADRWYQHAQALYELIPPNTPPPVLLLARAQVLLRLDKNDEARQLAEQVGKLDPQNVEARNLLERITAQPTTQSQSSTTQPAEAGAILSLLDNFPWQVLDYPLNPEKYLSLDLQMDNQSFRPGQSWPCRISLKNIGSFPITFGPDMMITPDILFAVQARGDQDRSSGPVIRITLNRTTRLNPGQSIGITQTLDIGSIRASMIGTPQINHEITVHAVLSPLRLVSNEGQEAWMPGIGGLQAQPLHFRRTAISPTDARIQSIIAASQTGSTYDRITATELLAMLLAEHQHLAADRLHYSASSVDAQQIQAAILARVDDNDWQVRAHLAECLRWFVLDKQATQVATRLLSDPHWLVRGLTLRMLTDHYDQRFRNVLEQYAKADPDDWCRKMAIALRERSGPTTQPATTSK